MLIVAKFGDDNSYRAEGELYRDGNFQLIGIQKKQTDCIWEILSLQHGDPLIRHAVDSLFQQNHDAIQSLRDIWERHNEALREWSRKNP